MMADDVQATVIIIDLLRQRQNGHHFADDDFEFIYF